MKIIQVVSSLDTGGIRSVIMGLCNELVKENDVYIGVYKGKKVDASHLFDTRIHILYFSSIKEFITIIRKYNIEIAHFHMSLKSGVFALFTKLFTKAKTACHSHISEDCRSGFIYFKMYKPISMYLIKKFCDLKIGCSDLAGKYLFKKDFVVVPNAVNTKKFEFSEFKRSEIRSKYDLNTYTYGYVGHIHSRKNLEFICNVLQEINKSKPLKLLIVGDYTEDKFLKERLLKYEFVEITGMVNDASSYYSAFDCMVLPSLFEGMPMVAIEAQSNGLDVYLSDTITTLLNVENHCHYLALNEYDAWLHTLKNAQACPRKIDNVCKNTEFDISVYANRIGDLYKWCWVNK